MQESLDLGIITSTRSYSESVDSLTDSFGGASAGPFNADDEFDDLSRNSAVSTIRAADVSSSFDLAPSKQSLFSRAWNSGRAVWVGHFLQGLFGIASFRMGYIEKRGFEANRTGRTYVRFNPQGTAGREMSERSHGQALLADNAEYQAMWNNPWAAVCEKLGKLVGTWARQRTGGPIRLSDITSRFNPQAKGQSELLEMHRGNVQKLAQYLAGQVSSVEEGLELANRRTDDGPEETPIECLRVHRALREYAFKENANDCDFDLAVELFKALHAGAEHNDPDLRKDVYFIFNVFVDSNAPREAGITTSTARDIPATAKDPDALEHHEDLFDLARAEVRTNHLQVFEQFISEYRASHPPRAARI